MAVAQVGDSIVVPVNLTAVVEGFENIIQTKGKLGKVIQRVLSGSNPVSNEEFFNYQLEFSENFDLINDQNEIVATVNTFYFTEEQLGGDFPEPDPLALSTKEINTAIRNNQVTTKNNLSNATKVLNQIPSNENVFRQTAVRFVQQISAGNDLIKNVRFNPNSQDSLQSITTDLEGSNLISQDSSKLLEFVNIIRAQEKAVTKRTNELNTSEVQSARATTRANEQEAQAFAKFINKVNTDTENLLVTTGDYTQIDWDAIEDEPPEAADLSTESTVQDLFPLLDPRDVDDLI